ncbi:MAG: NAD(P)/FAD-dependent oxidoreductase [Clostridia bacterium]|nr:NAD(P)/FAD-dependent oxidoreductase [Clostridia bacterium]
MYTENNKFDIIIVGGGAGGLAAAVCCAKKLNKNNCVRIAVLEKESKPCKKLLATGNGKCNLTNINMSEKYYNTNAQGFIKPLLSKYTPQKLIKFWGSLGLLCTPDSCGRVYPNSGQAVSAADTLLINLGKYNVQLFCDTPVNTIKKTKNGYIAGCNDKEYFCKKLILSAGGYVQPNLGSNGSGYALAKSLHLECSPLFPSLAPVLCKD